MIEEVERQVADDLGYIQKCAIHEVVRDLVSAVLASKPSKGEVMTFVRDWASKRVSEDPAAAAPVGCLALGKNDASKAGGPDQELVLSKLSAQTKALEQLAASLGITSSPGEGGSSTTGELTPEEMFSKLSRNTDKLVQLSG
ncbi:hypothetical protein DIPPA_10089 [Diplonema papillatum]|nr:hypothetical protein DIPPA_10089 [Diplonema papillatum]|eukprot:gene16869-25867_t